MAPTETTTSGRYLRLLVAEDNEHDFELLLLELRRGGYLPDALRVDTAASMTAALARPWDLVISDWSMPSFSALAVLALLAKHGADTPCIIMSGTVGEETAVKALQAGALDFVPKDRPFRLPSAVERALAEAQNRRARIAAETELRRSEARYRTVFEHAPEAIFAYDLESGEILEANDSAAKLFGRTHAELLSSTRPALSPPTQPDGRTSADASVALMARVKQGEAVVDEWTYVHADGHLISCEIRVVALQIGDRLVGRSSILDISDRKRLEEIRVRTAELELQNRRIREANRLKSEFLANMSHELRTPLNAIIGFTELLFDGQVPPETPQHHEFLGDILTSGRHLLQLINDVLDLAKVEAGKLEFRPEPVELAKLLGEVVSILRTTASGRRIQLELEVDRTLEQITLDPNRFKQVAYNYLSNALKFTPEGGRVTARVRPDTSADPAAAEHFVLEVEDSGIGIAAIDLPKLFVEFQQLESGIGKRHQGTGLGLALTRRLVEAQGGTVGVRSTEGHGSVFSATLPRRGSAGTERTSGPIPVIRVGVPTVLVIEDDPRDQAELATSLMDAGYAVELASTGNAALSRCGERAFDAVTLDLLLPDMSGLELLAALRGEARTHAIPVIVVTVVPDARVVAGFAVHDVLHKPLDTQRLLGSLARAGVYPDGTPPVAGRGGLKHNDGD